MSARTGAPQMSGNTTQRPGCRKEKLKPGSVGGSGGTVPVWSRGTPSSQGSFQA